MMKELQQPEDFMNGIYGLELNLVIDRLNKLLGIVALSRSEKEAGIIRDNFVHDAIINYFFIARYYFQPILKNWHKNEIISDRYFYTTKVLGEFAEIAIYILDIINIKVFEMAHAEKKTFDDMEIARFREIEKRSKIIMDSMQLIVNMVDDMGEKIE